MLRKKKFVFIENNLQFELFQTINSIEVLEIIKKLQNRNFDAYIVGGAIRDICFDLKPKDVDIVTNATPYEIKKIFTDNNLKIINSKKIQISRDEAAEFYKVHQTKPFYNDLCNYLSSGPIIVMILEGENAITKNRKIMGATNPKEAEEGTIRKKFGISIDKNSVHGSDSPENAKIEINFFFKN